MPLMKSDPFTTWTRNQLDTHSLSPGDSFVINNLAPNTYEGRAIQCDASATKVYGSGDIVVSETNGTWFIGQ